MGVPAVEAPRKRYNPLEGIYTIPSGAVKGSSSFLFSPLPPADSLLEHATIQHIKKRIAENTGTRNTIMVKIYLNF
jgi:hypothetical protein